MASWYRGSAGRFSRLFWFQASVLHGMLVLSGSKPKAHKLKACRELMVVGARETQGADGIGDQRDLKSGTRTETTPQPGTPGAWLIGRYTPHRKLGQLLLSLAPRAAGSEGLELLDLLMP